MKHAKVYITQEPTRWDPVAKTHTRSMDITPAAAWGELVILLPPGPVMLSTAPMVDALKDKLETFSDDDYLLGLGDPTAIAAAVMVASQANHGRVKLLRWDRVERLYLVVHIDLYPNRGD